MAGFGDIAGRVLVVDDDEGTCRLYKYALEKAGIGAHWVQNARDAQEIVKTGDFALALIDIVLGHDDGPALADALCSSRPDLSILLMTSHDIALLQVQSRHAIIEKPAPNKIHSVVERVMTHLTLRWTRLTVMRLDERIATYTMSNLIKEFFSDWRGKVLFTLLSAIFTYAVARGEGFVSRLEQLERSSIESVTLLKRIERETRR